MNNDYKENDYQWIKELMLYPCKLEKNLEFFQNTSQISVPQDPIEKVVFQNSAKKSIRRIAQNKGHLLMVGKPGTGKSMLANMFNEVLEQSLGDYLKPKEAIVAYPGKDKNHIRIAYEKPEKIDNLILNLNKKIETARDSRDDFNLSDQINSVKKVKKVLFLAACVSAVAGVFFPPAFITTGLFGIGSIFMYLQENNHKAQEKIQIETNISKGNDVKPWLTWSRKSYMIRETISV